MADSLGPYLLGPCDDDPNNGIYTGDARELAKAIPDESVDLIYTDPPYAREFNQVWRDLGHYSPRILKPHGKLLTLCGHYQVPFVIKCLDVLDWYWMGWLIHSGPKRTLAGKWVVCGGKPLLFFSKGNPRLEPRKGPWWDTKNSGSRDKRFHVWGQPTAYVIQDLRILTHEESIILDPFCGGGNLPAACRMFGRRYLAFEIDPDVAETARERVRMTQAPLPGLLVEQGEMGL